MEFAVANYEGGQKLKLQLHSFKWLSEWEDSMTEMYLNCTKL